MENRYRKGQKVHWSWGAHTAHGKIEERFERHVRRTIKGQRISRNGSTDNPAYLVVQHDGGKVLKLGSELAAE